MIISFVTSFSCREIPHAIRNFERDIYALGVDFLNWNEITGRDSAISLPSL